MNDESKTDFSTIVDENAGHSEKDLWRKYGGYYALHLAKRFFVGERKFKKESGQQFRDVAESLIVTLNREDNTESQKFILETSQKLLDSHRMVEDTHARRRLERWARKTIKYYLIIVLVLVLLNGASRIIWNDIFEDAGFISDSVMYAVLTTTTVNILGLGFIVLRGHFPQEEKKSAKKSNSQQEAAGSKDG